MFDFARDLLPGLVKFWALTPPIKTDKDNQRKNLQKNCRRNPKKFYGFMRKMQTVRAEVRQLSINKGTGLTKTDTEAAEVLCEHFQQVFTKEKGLRTMHEYMPTQTTISKYPSTN